MLGEDMPELLIREQFLGFETRTWTTDKKTASAEDEQADPGENDVEAIPGLPYAVARHVQRRASASSFGAGEVTEQVLGSLDLHQLPSGSERGHRHKRRATSLRQDAAASASAASPFQGPDSDQSVLRKLLRVATVAWDTSAYVGNRSFHIDFPKCTRDKSCKGYGSDSNSMAVEGYFRSSASQAGYAAVYLDASPKPHSKAPSKGRVWNSGSCGDFASVQKVDDVGFVLDVVKEVVANHSADPARIFLVGISNGGSMVVRMICEHPEVFAGAVSLHGSLESHDGKSCAAKCLEGYCDWSKTESNCSMKNWQEGLPEVFSCASLKQRPVPLMLINGMASPYTDPNGAVYSLKVEKQSGWQSYPPLSYMFDFFRKAYGCEYLRTSYKKGKKGDQTHCGTCESQKSNLTLCEADAGDWWYGKTYDVVAPCLFTGGKLGDCNPHDVYQTWGRTTQTIDVSAAVIEFFDGIFATKKVN
eukprot:TRINITY_DN41204_c0_g1_i1.p1 TRINITY_DN41204_c0_g1~~TRINITY_DN41204_c0_g1_i1.p1  ORF type:complete len:507 (+),score=103.82 TRINITY_DN41204_c0_g1_i1:101-1522(+)